MKPLHVAASLHIVAKHTHMPGIGIAVARDVIQRVAASKARTHEDQQLVDELEERTGVPIAELAKLTEKWLPKG